MSDLSTAELRAWARHKDTHQWVRALLESAADEIDALRQRVEILEITVEANVATLRALRALLPEEEGP